MLKYFLVLFCVGLSFTALPQQAAISLMANNSIYLGLDNPFNFAVEGQNNANVKISAKGCEIITGSSSYFLKAKQPGKCTVTLSYKTKGHLDSQTFDFRVKPFPLPEAYLGALEQGNYTAKVLSSQGHLHANVPNFTLCGVSFSIRSYKWSFVGNSIFNSFCQTQLGNEIPEKLRHCIAFSNPGDKIIIEDIVVNGPGGISKRLAPVEYLVISENSTRNDFYHSYKNFEDSSLTFHRFVDTTFCCNEKGNVSNGLLKKYKITGSDSALLYELKVLNRKVKWIKEYYSDGKVKATYNFEKNDSFGKAFYFYPSGNLKAEGYVLADIPNVEKAIRISADSIKQISKLINGFLSNNFTPINQWMAYYESGVLAFECHIGLVGSNIPFEDGGVSSDDEGEYSIEQAFKYSRTKLFPVLIKQFTAFDKNGDIIIEQNFTIR